MRSNALPLLAVLVASACSGELELPSTGAVGAGSAPASGGHAGSDGGAGSPAGAGVDAGPVGAPTDGGAASSPDLSPTCASVTCGSHAQCDPSTVRCACQSGYTGDPVLGCVPTTPCGMCGAHSHCDTGTNTCACDPGYVAGAGGCGVATPTDPSLRVAADVCAAWKQGHVVSDGQPFTPGATACDPGTLSPAGIADVVRRVNLFRWLGGLYPVDDDPAHDAADQACAVMEGQNGMLNHMPPPTWQCYSPTAAGAAGSSNLALGTDAAGQIDLYMDDGGVPSLGHRRWVMNPPLDAIGVGWANGAGCLGVFNGGNMEPASTFQAVPNPGPAPVDTTRFATWTVDTASYDLSAATITVTRKDDGANMPVQVVPLPYGYGVNAVGFTRNGWDAEVGRTYAVDVTRDGVPPIHYEVTPVACN